MPNRTLQDFVAELERMGELRRIAYPADPYLEITEIADRVMKAGGPALLFENPRGARFPLLINAFGSQRRMNAALGVDSLNEIAEQIEEIVKLELPQTWGGKLQALGKLSRVAN